MGGYCRLFHNGFLEALDEDQLKMTVAAFKEYAWDFEDVDPNFSNGILTALDRCLREM